MKIVIAPDSYKESLTALEVAEKIQEGFSQIFPDANYHLMPVADGGEGTVSAIISATKGHYLQKEVTGPLGDPVLASYGITGDGKTAVIEMAEASGLMLVPKKERNPYLTTSFGTGELILDALNHGITKIILGIGGSATNDGGVGMIQALGGRFLNSDDETLPFGGKALSDLATIDLSDLDPRIAHCEFEIACDVDNPLTGERGASVIFGPQKGATPEMVKVLDYALYNYAMILGEYFDIDVNSIKGSGAAGGMGTASVTFLNGTLRAGVDIVMEAIHLESVLIDADLVITGEGKIDRQTCFGKVPVGVAKIAKKYQKPVIAIAGCLEEGYELTYEQGIDAVFSIVSAPMSLEEAYEITPENLTQLSRNIANVLQMGQRFRN
ncbi:glycerate kinase [Ignatzschineria sp. LJL83]